MFTSTVGVGAPTNYCYDDQGFIFREADFALVNQLGFNFFRLPFHYDLFYSTYDEMVDMAIIHWLDVAIEFAIRYNVHLSFNMWKAPGWSVLDGWSPEGPNILNPNRDDARHFKQIWQMLAHRYRDIPNNLLSFNLLNEPIGASFLDWDGTSPVEQYRILLEETITAIRAEREDRLIILDVDGRIPLNLDALNVSTHNLFLSPHLYAPYSFTHDGMHYVSTFPDEWTDKNVVWPIVNYFNGYLWGPWKSWHMFGNDTMERGIPAVFVNAAGFDEGTITMRLIQVNDNFRLRVYADGVFTGEESVPHGLPAGTHITFEGITVPSGTTRIEIFSVAGDFMLVDYYEIAGITVQSTNVDWGYQGTFIEIGADTVTDSQSILQWFFQDAWDFNTIPTFIGEWSSMATTPEKVAYRALWAADVVDAFGDMPWAIWEFKGGAMSMFRLSRSDQRGFTTPFTVTYGGGQTLTYWIDQLWYDAIKHSLDFHVIFP